MKCSTRLDINTSRLDINDFITIAKITCVCILLYVIVYTFVFYLIGYQIVSHQLVFFVLRFKLKKVKMCIIIKRILRFTLRHFSISTSHIQMV